jgi:hypothetical protein
VSSLWKGKSRKFVWSRVLNMRLAIASLPCLSLILVGCSSYNAPKAAPAPLPVPTPPAATPMFSNRTPTLSLALCIRVEYEN